MTRNEPFAYAQIHHIALRVDDAQVSKDWFLNKLEFHVDREFSFNGMDFVWLCSKESTVRVIELIGGGC
jgi:catechol 2,3-dioxygenase-like lactoylglutathione lyase family enzyme